MAEPVPPAARAWREPGPFAVTAHGHDLTVYPAGADRRTALLRLIGDARRSLRMCFYIFAQDQVSVAVRDALVAAARRGVAVTLLVDDFGATADADFLAPLIAAGGRYRRFGASFGRRYLIRNHQKLVIADDARAMFGGFNVEDDYFAGPQANGWVDLAFIVTGPSVARLAAWFDALDRWTGDPRHRLRTIMQLVRDWDGGPAPVQWLIGGPTRGLSRWAACVRRDLGQGRRLDLMMAYFSPGPGLLRRIGHLAKRGEARLVMAGKSDNGATIGASRLLYDRLLGHGAQIHEFVASKLHTKLLVVDDIVYIGSANFDARSLFINLELMLRIEDAAFADRMRDLIDRHLPGAISITPAFHRRRATWTNRLRWAASWFLVSVVDYTVSRDLNLGL